MKNVPIVFSRMLLNQLESKLFREKHESVHRTLRLIRVVLLLLLGRRWRRRHLAGWRNRYQSGHRSHQRGKWIVGRELESPEPVAQIRSPDCFRMVRRQADVTDGQVVARNSVFFDRHSRLSRTPAWKKNKKSILNELKYAVKPEKGVPFFSGGMHKCNQVGCGSCVRLISSSPK